MIRYFETSTNIVASVLLFFACMLTLIDVVGRNLLGSPLPGATELTEIAMVGITFLIFPRLAYRQQHISVDLLDFLMGPLMRRIQQIIAGVLGAAIFFAIGWRLWFLAARSAAYGDVTAFLRIPLSPIITAMSVMSMATSLAFAVTIVLAVTSPRHHFEDVSDKIHTGSD
jgi:TRAP-type transport system small permease protein